MSDSVVYARVYKHDNRRYHTSLTPDALEQCFCTVHRNRSVGHAMRRHKRSRFTIASALLPSHGDRVHVPDVHPPEERRKIAPGLLRPRQPSETDSIGSARPTTVQTLCVSLFQCGKESAKTVVTHSHIGTVEYGLRDGPTLPEHGHDCT